MQISKFAQRKFLLVGAAYLIIFLIGTVIIQSTRYIDLRIDGEGLLKDDTFMPETTFQGKFILNAQSRYFMRRIQGYVFVEDLFEGNEDPVEFVQKSLESQLKLKGWKPSPPMDFGKNDCDSLLPESNFFQEHGYLAFRRERYEPSFDFYAGDLICLYVSADETDTDIQIILVTAKPTFSYYVMEFLSY